MRSTQMKLVAIGTSMDVPQVNDWMQALQAVLFSKELSEK